MKPKVCLIDTNVVVAGLISGEPSSPPLLILDRPEPSMHCAAVPLPSRARYSRLSLGPHGVRCASCLFRLDLPAILPDSDPDLQVSSR